MIPKYLAGAGHGAVRETWLLRGFVREEGGGGHANVYSFLHGGGEVESELFEGGGRGGGRGAQSGREWRGREGVIPLFIVEAGYGSAVESWRVDPWTVGGGAAPETATSIQQASM